MKTLHAAFAALAALLLLAAPAQAHTGHGGVPIPFRVVQSTQPAQEQVVDVSLFEWGLTPSVVEVDAGTVRFVAANDGAVGHAFKITGNGVEAETEVFPAGEVRALTVELAPGEYDLWCPVPGHRGLGMEAGFRALAGEAPEPGLSIERALDANDNARLDDAEIVRAVELWIAGEPVPGAAAVISDETMLALIRLWATGGPIA